MSSESYSNNLHSAIALNRLRVVTNHNVIAGLPPFFCFFLHAKPGSGLVLDVPSGCAILSNESAAPCENTKRLLAPCVCVCVCVCVATRSMHS